ncbi:MAG TPA: hypothetical protein VGH24_10410 [Solirubrobacteraceae bacterium]
MSDSGSETGLPDGTSRDCLSRGALVSWTCTRLVAVGRFTHADKAVRASVRFTGRVHCRSLTSGRYRLSLTARDANGASRPLVARFTIRRP